MSDEKQNVLALQFVWRGKAYGISMTTPNRSPLSQALLPKRKPRVVAFSTALCLQFTLLLLIVVLSALMPERFDAVRQYLVTSVVAQPVSAWKPQPVRRSALSRHADPSPPTTSTKPIIPSPVAAMPIAKPVKALGSTPTDVPDVANTVPTSGSALPLGSSAIPTLKKPRQDVQTGGFGDPDGVTSNDKKDRSANIPEVGSYDLPGGPGRGNGLGAERGTAGVVASAGFGNELAGSVKRLPGRNVHEGLFGDEQAATEKPRIKQVATLPSSTPVEILFKPKPVYTDAARAKKVEGEVLVEVTFLASGEIRIGRILKGLGDGLDESAEVAARQIRFRPATQDGRPIDSTAIVHIVFQLAY
ncbi:MAG TPA: energy transducer TonB [Candidatus Eisenbacteria bacterium]|nr:energy transducer TonB [Candidatus Eisenbacteria bacterium]